MTINNRKKIKFSGFRKILKIKISLFIIFSKFFYLLWNDMINKDKGPEKINNEIIIPINAIIACILARRGHDFGLCGIHLKMKMN